MQLNDNHSPEVVAEHKAILPMYELLAKYPIKDLNWFVPATSSFIRDGKGRLLAFPWMAEVPVMFYNTAAYKKAGLEMCIRDSRAFGWPGGAVAPARRACDQRCVAMARAWLAALFRADTGGVLPSSASLSCWLKMGSMRS